MPPPDRPKRPRDPRLWEMWAGRQRMYERSRFDAEVVGWLFQAMSFVLVTPFRILLRTWRKQRRAAQWRRFVYGPRNDDPGRRE